MVIYICTPFIQLLFGVALEFSASELPVNRKPVEIRGKRRLTDIPAAFASSAHNTTLHSVCYITTYEGSEKFMVRVLFFTRPLTYTPSALNLLAEDLEPLSYSSNFSFVNENF